MFLILERAVLFFFSCSSELETVFTFVGVE